MIKIDSETQGLICIQLPISERQGFINKLNSLLISGTTITLKAIGGIIQIILSETDFIIDASRNSEIIVTLKYDDCVDLVEAIQEHLEEDTNLPLDHSFESFGAKLVPESLEDVVFETI